MGNLVHLEGVAADLSDGPKFEPGDAAERRVVK